MQEKEQINLEKGTILLQTYGTSYGVRATTISVNPQSKEPYESAIPVLYEGSYGVGDYGVFGKAEKENYRLGTYFEDSWVPEIRYGKHDYQIVGVLDSGKLVGNGLYDSMTVCTIFDTENNGEKQIKAQIVTPYVATPVPGHTLLVKKVNDIYQIIHNITLVRMRQRMMAGYVL